MRIVSLIAVLALALAGCTVTFSSNEQDKQPINPGTVEQQKSVSAAARQIAFLFDHDRLDEAWALTGPMLRNQTSRLAFIAGVKAFRSSLGPAGDRVIKGFNFPKELDGVKGDFGLIGVETDFANVQAVQEKFVFQRLGDQWKLVGYWLTKKRSFGPMKTSNNSFKPKPLRGSA
jgi:hypothetical protein